MRKYFVLIIAIFLVFASCKKQESIPEEVQKVLDLSGENQSELLKAIHFYQDLGHQEKLQALYFLIENMSDKSYLEYRWMNDKKEDLGFDVLDFVNYNKVVLALDSLKREYGAIQQFKTKEIKDYESISADFLVQTIGLAFEAWKNYAWASHLDFDQFCEYILPYRGSNEPLENWRKDMMEEYAWVSDSIEDITDPVEACSLINNEIKSWFSFDPRFYEQKTDQSYSEMKEKKLGRCEDMTNLATFAMRSMGVPVMTDFTPYWANTGNNHAWNAIINNKNKVVIFMGGEANPGAYQLHNKWAKVYRKTFAIQKDCLSEQIGDSELAPAYINRKNIVDVTRQYCPVTDAKPELFDKLPEGPQYAYICVFNTGEWKAVHYSKIEEGKVCFTDMAMNIAYMPAFYQDKKIIPAGNPFILDSSRAIHALKADFTHTLNISLRSTTKKVTRNTTDEIDQVFLKKGKKYYLYYWDNEWKLIGMQRAGNRALEFKNIPFNALFWLKEENSRNEERIFTVDHKGNQIWW